MTRDERDGPRLHASGMLAPHAATIEKAFPLPPHPATVLQAKRPHAAQRRPAPGKAVQARAATAQMMQGPVGWSVTIAPTSNKKKATLAFGSPDGTVVSFEPEVTMHDLKVFLKHIGYTGTIGTKPPNLVVSGVDQNILLTKVRADVSKCISNYLARANAPLPTVEATSHVALTHAAIVKLLVGMVPTKVGTGHPSIQMAVIRLPRSCSLLVACQQRTITHLYTQVIDKREARCYLGNEHGAYQRVHTSLTDDNSAHTMVQFGPTVIIPGHNDIGIRGIRTGFDLFGPGLWLSPKKLVPRSQSQCTVKNSIDGVLWSTLEPDLQLGCELMARAFNRTLESALYDLLRASNVKATWLTNNFEILDTVWLLPSGAQETPIDFLAFSRKDLFLAALLPDSTYEDSLRYRRFAASELPEI